MKTTSPSLRRTLSRRAGSSLLAISALAIVGAGKNWVTEIERGPVSHTVGSPDAELTVTDFSSYTCSHCGNFARTGGEVMKLAYVGPGKSRVEIRHVIRNPIDLAATLGVWCGDKDKFLANHAAIMFAQDDWLTRAGNATQGQQQRWFNGTMPQRLRAIASDLGFYEIFERRGYERTELDRCLADTARMETLYNATVSDAETYGIRGTPSFAIDGKLLEGTHSWETLQPQIQSTLTANAKLSEGLDAESEVGDSAFSLE